MSMSSSCSLHGEGGDDFAGLLGDVHRDDAFAAAIGARRYSSNGVRLPRPFSLTTSIMVLGSLVTQVDEVVVVHPSVMPRTPAVARPIGRRFGDAGSSPVSWKRSAHAFVGDEAALPWCHR